MTVSASFRAATAAGASAFRDAADAPGLEGELVYREDLVLHDAHMDIRTPTHELTRAPAVLRARRRIFCREVGLGFRLLDAEDEGRLT